jgi:hypothetical protein
MSFLIDFTIDQCAKRGIPTKKVRLDGVFDYTAKAFKSEKLPLPVNPATNAPLLLIPKRCGAAPIRRTQVRKT